jgi:catechol 2,3-dioxygenase-like lactoylglutathione lyase family enzyme
MALIDGVDLVFYQVCNMDRAVAFYEGILGLELLKREGNDWAELDCGGVTLALSGELAVAPQQGGATVTLRTPDMAALVAHLAASGARTGSVQDLGGALMLDIYDPEGNELVAIQPA